MERQSGSVAAVLPGTSWKNEPGGLLAGSGAALL